MIRSIVIDHLLLPIRSGRLHQPGQANFRSILAEEVNWQPFPAFPPAARLAILVGHPNKLGPYVIRVKVPGGTKLMPHNHSEDRIYTVISGILYIGLGGEFDGDKIKAYPPGTSSSCPAKPGTSTGPSPANT